MQAPRQRVQSGCRQSLGHACQVAPAPPPWFQAPICLAGSRRQGLESVEDRSTPQRIGYYACIDLGKGQPRSLLIGLASMAVGAWIGFVVGSGQAHPIVLVSGKPTTLHIYRFDGNLPKPGNGEKVIFDQALISRFVTEVNQITSFPRFGRQCDSGVVTYELDFDYNNGDRITVDVRSSPCGMVTAPTQETFEGDALNSQLLKDIMGFVGGPSSLAPGIWIPESPV